MNTAKEGHKIAPRARAKLAHASRAPIEAIPLHVVAKSGTTAGQWVCIDCGDLPTNNMNAQTHGEKPRHRIAWRIPSGEIEVP